MFNCNDFIDKSHHFFAEASKKVIIEEVGLVPCIPYKQSEIIKVYKISLSEDGRENKIKLNMIAEICKVFCSRICFDEENDIDNYKYFYFVILNKQRRVEECNLYMTSTYTSAKFKAFEKDSIHNKPLNVERKLLVYFLFAYFTFDELNYEKKSIEEIESITSPINIPPTNEPDSKKNMHDLLGAYDPSKRIIYLFDNTIKFYYDKYFSKEISLTDFRTMILFHEIGHCVFDYGKYKWANKEYSERLADFVCSFFTLGSYDYTIANLNKLSVGFLKKQLMYCDRLYYNMNEQIIDLLKF